MNRIVLYLFAIASIVFADSMNAMSLKEIRSKAFSQVNSINSVQLTYTFEITRQENGKTDQTQGKVEYLQNGGMYFIKTVIYNVGRDGEDHTFITAYNGDYYQEFGPNGKHEKELDYTKQNLIEIPSLYPIPIVSLYGWVVAGSPKATRQNLSFSLFPDVKREDVWNSSFDHATLLDADEKGNQRVRFSNSKKDATVEVTFDVDRNYLPIVSEFIKKDGYGKVSVDGIVTKEDSEGNRYFFPAKLTDQSRKNDGDEVTFTYKIEPETLKVNSDIGKDLFTIPASWADTVIDFDAAQANKETVPRPKSYLPVKMCLGALGIILMAFGIYSKRRSRKTTV